MVERLEQLAAHLRADREGRPLRGLECLVQRRLPSGPPRAVEDRRVERQRPARLGLAGLHRLAHRELDHALAVESGREGVADPPDRALELAAPSLDLIDLDRELLRHAVELARRAGRTRRCRGPAPAAGSRRVPVACAASRNSPIWPVSDRPTSAAETSASHQEGDAAARRSGCGCERRARRAPQSTRRRQPRAAGPRRALDRVHATAVLDAGPNPRSSRARRWRPCASRGGTGTPSGSVWARLRSFAEEARLFATQLADPFRELGSPRSPRRVSTPRGSPPARSISVAYRATAVGEPACAMTVPSADCRPSAAASPPRSAPSRSPPPPPPASAARSAGAAARRSAVRAASSVASRCAANATRVPAAIPASACRSHCVRVSVNSTSARAIIGRITIKPEEQAQASAEAHRGGTVAARLAARQAARGRRRYHETASGL